MLIDVIADVYSGHINSIAHSNVDDGAHRTIAQKRIFRENAGLVKSQH
jgi:hypothetical protein